jgi:PHS family inorganic phosphate transporter-like MFS transporter
MASEVEKAQVNHTNGALTAGARRRAALAEVNEAKFSRFHVKTCIVAGALFLIEPLMVFVAVHELTPVAGVGFFTDAYDIFSISIVALMIGYVYHQGGSNTANQDLGLKVSTPIGTFFGQLLFGWLADHAGRKRMYGIELVSVVLHSDPSQPRGGVSG